MEDEYIKDILIALINKGQIYLGTSNEEIAENMAKFVRVFKAEVEKEI